MLGRDVVFFGSVLKSISLLIGLVILVSPRRLLGSGVSQSPFLRRQIRSILSISNSRHFTDPRSVFWSGHILFVIKKMGLLISSFISQSVLNPPLCFIPVRLMGAAPPRVFFSPETLGIPITDSPLFFGLRHDIIYSGVLKAFDPA